MVAHGYGEAGSSGALLDRRSRQGRCRHNRTSGNHFAFQANRASKSMRFYLAAIHSGAKDNGLPGIRAHYHPNYYGAFAFDPDGNKIEACCHLPE